MSVIIPALNEEAALPGTLASLALQPAEPPLEVILADGGSTDRTIPLFEATAARWVARGWTSRVVVVEPPGRAIQMNAGARVASGDPLLFLHADTHLPAGATNAITRALSDPAAAGGGFRLRYPESGWLLRLIGAWATARARLRHIHYGDQAMFFRRSAFEAAGGFPDMPLFEDLEIARALRRRGTIVTLPLPVDSSARRLLGGGVLRTGLQFALLRVRYGLGADAARLRAGYPDER